MNSIVQRVLNRVRNRDITVNITQADINKGVRASGSHCPVGLAVRRLFPAALEVRVNHRGLQVVFVTHSLQFDAPSAMTDWIRAYDKDGKGEPRSFRAIYQRRIEHDEQRQANLRRWYPIYP